MDTSRRIYVDLDNRTKEIGLTINVEKTKILTQTRSRRVLQNVTIDDDKLERVINFTYLGVILSKDDNEETKVRHVVRMDGQRMPKRILEASMGGVRPVERHRRRGQEEVADDARFLLTSRNWRISEEGQAS
ncbi:hypothetical protein Trydic_g7998 [Trypoxylus dichotomus]